MRTNIFMLTAFVLLTACTENQTDESVSTITKKTISKSEYGKNWPFTIDEGVLQCINGSIVFIYNDKIYGVNGTAKAPGKNLGYSNIEEIWALDPAYSQDKQNHIRINIGPILEDGLKLCKD